MLLHQRLRLDIPPQVSKFLGARTGDRQIKALRDGRTEHFGFAMLQPLSCLVLHSMFFLRKQHCRSHPRDVSCVFTPSPFPTLSHLTSGTAWRWVQALRAVLSPVPCPQPGMCWHSQDAQGHSFPRSHTGRGGRSASPSGWAPSWSFSPIIPMKWIIFKWHFPHCPSTVSSQHQRAFGSTFFAPALRGTFTGKALQAPSAPGQGGHPNDSTDSSYMKHNRVKYFLYQSFLHLNLLTVNFRKPYRPR